MGSVLEEEFVLLESNGGPDWWGGSWPVLKEAFFSDEEGVGSALVGRESFCTEAGETVLVGR